jgi:hypothetical protein
MSRLFGIFLVVCDLVSVTGKSLLRQVRGAAEELLECSQQTLPLQWI